MSQNRKHAAAKLLRHGRALVWSKAPSNVNGTQNKAPGYYQCLIRKEACTHHGPALADQHIAVAVLLQTQGCQVRGRVKVVRCGADAEVYNQHQSGMQHNSLEFEWLLRKKHDKSLFRYACLRAQASQTCSFRCNGEIS